MQGNYWGSSLWILCNRSTTDNIFCIHQILEKKEECNEEVHQLLTLSRRTTYIYMLRSETFK